MLVRDFNAEDSEICLSNFLFEINTKNIVNNYTRYKSVENPSFINLVITNSPLSYQNTITISADLSDFYKMVITVLKTEFAKLKRVLKESYIETIKTLIETNLRENWREN